MPNYTTWAFSLEWAIRKDGLYGVDIPKCAFPFLLRYMRDVDHVHGLNLGRKLLLASSTRPARFVVVLALGALALFFGCDLCRPV
jgi:hypothetical protein